MAFTDLFNPILDTIFGPLLGLPPLAAVALMSFFVSFLISVIYKYTTDQNLMKRLRDEMTELQREAKELRDHPEKALAVQKQMMETNMKYMMQSMRSTLFTMLPILLIFGWMSGHFAYTPLMMGDTFTVGAEFNVDSGEATLEVPQGLLLLNEAKQPLAQKRAEWSVKAGKAGDYLLRYTYLENMYEMPVHISSGERKYTPEKLTVGKEGLENLYISYAQLPILPYLGWGWLGSYILFSIFGSMVWRKWLKVY